MQFPDIKQLGVQLLSKTNFLTLKHGFTKGPENKISLCSLIFLFAVLELQRPLDTWFFWLFRLKASGAVLVAKLVTGSMAYDDIWFGGRTRNPWNIEEFSTGSSAGPAASTSAG